MLIFFDIFAKKKILYFKFDKQYVMYDGML